MAPKFEREGWKMCGTIQFQGFFLHAMPIGPELVIASLHGALIQYFSSQYDRMLKISVGQTFGYGELFVNRKF
jgi:hypothetical protein